MSPVLELEPYSSKLEVVEEGFVLQALPTDITRAEVTYLIGQTRLRDLLDVDAPYPEHRQSLTYDAYSGTWVPGEGGGGASSFAELTGQIADDQVPESAVTQHQGALSIAWGQLTGVPSSFTPSAHTHPWADISATPTTLGGYGITDAAYQSDLVTVSNALSAHLLDTNNPHNVTKAQVALGNVENTALSTWAGSANITTLGTLTSLTVSGAATLQSTLDITGVTTTAARIETTRTLATGTVHRAFVTGDTVPRWTVYADGKMEWGPGSSTAIDTTLSRSAAGTLTLTGTGFILPSGALDGVAIGWSASLGLFNPAANTIVFQIGGTGVGNQKIQCDNVGITLASGYRFGWTSGNATNTPDPTFVRRAAGQIAFFGATAANTGVTIGSNATPDATALMEFISTTKGVLFPRMTGTQRDAITSPPDGLVLYNSTTNKLQVRAAGAWADMN